MNELVYLKKNEMYTDSYNIMEGMNRNDNGRKTATRKKADGQVQGKSKACQV